MEPERIELVRAWLKKADHDLTNARIVLESNEAERPFDTVCFHCQQAAEDLSPYGVDVRYPDEFYLPNEQEAQQAYALADEVLRYIQGKVEAFTKGFSS